MCPKNRTTSKQNLDAKLPTYIHVLIYRCEVTCLVFTVVYPFICIRIVRALQMVVRRVYLLALGANYFALIKFLLKCSRPYSNNCLLAHQCLKGNGYRLDLHIVGS